MTTAQKIRAELKGLGITNKQVSVRTSNGSVRVVILDLNINKQTLEDQVRKYESYEVCEFTQEILQGGNTFVFVDYDYMTLSNWRKEFAEPLANEMIKDYQDTEGKNDKRFFGDTGVISIGDYSVMAGDIELDENGDVWCYVNQKHFTRGDLFYKTLNAIEFMFLHKLNKTELYLFN